MAPPSIPTSPSPEAVITELSQRGATPEFNTARYRLCVATGDAIGSEIVVEPAARVLIGQSPACDLKLTDRTVSRRHVAVESTPFGLRVTDLQSRNGTWVDKVRLFDAIVEGGQSLRVGDTVIQCSRLADQPANEVKPPKYRFGRVIGASPQMQRVYTLCETIAPTDLPVVIEGETGTGKELLAEAIHEASLRKEKPFIVFDCTTVPATLLEATLFGHERGAFTGAESMQVGVFEAADGGTLFIDEIGDLALPLQSRLLRAIQNGEIQRVGSTKWNKVNVRVIAATRRDLDREVQEGRFRDDLFYRLAVARIEIPPLRSREGDIALLSTHLWREYDGEGDIPVELLSRFTSYAWPGNVRELDNTMARHVALGDQANEKETLPESETIGAGNEHDVIAEVLRKDLPLTSAREEVVEAFERRYVARVLAKYNGSVQRAAAASGIKRRYFQLLKARHKP